jgi:hypothetical protein
MGRLHWQAVHPDLRSMHFTLVKIGDKWLLAAVKSQSTAHVEKIIVKQPSSAYAVSASSSSIYSVTRTMQTLQQLRKLTQQCDVISVHRRVVGAAQVAPGHLVL